MIRLDQQRTFVRISDGAPVVWKSSVTRYKWHATADNETAVCSSAVKVSDFNPYPSVFDRSNDLSTCDSCAGLVKRVPKG